MPDDEKTTDTTTPKEPAAEPVPSSLPASGPGGFGGVTKWVPTPEEVAEQKRIHAEVEASK